MKKQLLFILSFLLSMNLWAQKLPVTFYKNISQVPAFDNYSMKGRTYRFMSDPLFPFGFGLSYTTFSIGDAKVNKTAIKKDERVKLTIPVSNTGKRNGIETVQVYIHKVDDAGGPIKTLRGFERVNVGAGKTSIAAINLPYSSFEFFDEATGNLAVTAGKYEVLYGTSSDNKDLKSIKVSIE